LDTQPTTTRTDEQRTLFGILLGCGALLLFVICMFASIIAVLTLLGPAIGTQFQSIPYSVHCAFVFEDKDGNGVFNQGDVDITDKNGITLRLIDANGQTLYSGKPRGCWYPQSVLNSTVTEVLTLPPTRTTTNPTKTYMFGTWMQDASPVYFPVTEAP